MLTHIHTHIYRYTCVCVYICMYVYTCVCVHVCKCICIYRQVFSPFLWGYWFFQLYPIWYFIFTLVVNICVLCSELVFLQYHLERGPTNLLIACNINLLTACDMFRPFGNYLFLILVDVAQIGYLNFYFYVVASYFILIMTLL